MTNATRTKTQLTVLFVQNKSIGKRMRAFKYFRQRTGGQQLLELGKSKFRQLTKHPKKHNSHHL